ncbi:T9SS type B sorting domain-containing protein [Chitinophaga sp. SYP-B3965]|uniref:gliding motility-associated C-terminal domain-containing protein n=1 Tax=Chitinophaga sp. SYP-B3965 TaxID=2663120 RepID=UPI001299E699|nr:gliding motility-associated C-terminal domain-containing protein [Chitinophaga sp. SYP-B3965]MRG46730.1 T9SS type B sorting domain-containing protein [Chitinophaga sp. SYP-B3965]
MRNLIVLTAIWLLTGSVTRAHVSNAAPVSHMQYWYPTTEITTAPAVANWYGRSPLLHQQGNAFLTPSDIRSFFAAGPISSPGISDEDIRPLICLGCNITQQGQSHDGSLTTASHITIGIGLAARVGQRIIFPGTYENGDSVVLDFEVPGTLSASVLSSIRVQAFNGASLVTTVNISDLGTLQVLGTGIGTSGKKRAIMAIGGTFDRVEVTIGSLASLLNELYIYEVTAVVPVTVSPSANPIVSPAGQSAVLNASHRLGAATFRWYDAPQFGNLLYTGSTFTTPVLFRGVQHYYVEATTTADSKSSFIRTAANVDVGGGPGLLWTFGDEQQSPRNSGVCALCLVTDPQNAIDGDTTTSSMLSMPVGLLSSVGQLIKFPGIYQSGDSIVLDLELPGQLYTKQLLSGISIQPYNGAAAAGPAIVLDNALVRLQVLGLGVGGTSKFRVVVPSTVTFDGVQVNLNALFAELGFLRVYEAAAMIPVAVTPSPALIPYNTSANLSAAIRSAGATFSWYTQPTGGAPVATGASFATPALTRSTTYYVEAATPDGLKSFKRTVVPVRLGGSDGPLWSYGDTQESPKLTGVCIACSVQNPLLAIDGDTTTASTVSIPLGALSSAGQLIRFPGNYQALDSIILDLAIPAGQLLSGQLLSSIRIETFNGATSNNDATAFNTALGNAQLLGIAVGNTGKFRITLPATAAFDAVQVSLAPVLGGLSSLQIYEATAMVPVTVNPATQTIPYGTTATINGANRLSSATLNWYTTPTGGSAVFSGPSFVTPNLTRQTKYYVEAATPDGKTSYVRTLATVNVGGGAGPLWTYGDREESPQITGICLGCNVQDAANAVDGNPNTSSLLNMTIGALGGISQIIHFPGTYQALDSIALDLEVPNQLFNGQLLAGITVQTYNGSTPNPDAITLDNNAVRLQALGFGVGTTGKFRITIPVNSAFDGVKIGTTAALAGLGALRIYEAVAFMPIVITPPAPVIPSGTTATMTASVRAPGATYTWYDTPTGGTALGTTASFTTPPLTRGKTYYAEAATPDGKTSFVRTAAPVTVSGGPGPLWTYADQQTSPIIGGICLGCSVQNPNRAVDGDTTTASTEVITVGVAGSVGQLLKFPGTYQALDSISFTLGVPSQLLSGQLLSGIRVQTFNGGVPNNDAITLDNNLINLQALGLDPTGSVGKFRVTIPVNSGFDAAQVDLTGLVSGLTNLNIYEAAAFIPVTVTPPAPIVVPFGSDTTLTASIRIPGATFSWYDTPTGGTPLFTGATFNTPVLIGDRTFYVEASTPDGLKSYIRTAVPVTVRVGPGSPDLSCGRGITQTNGTVGLLCLLCAVNTPELSVDDNPQTSSRLHVPVGLLGGVQQTLTFGHESSVGDSLRIVVGSTTGLLNLALLGNVSIRPRNNGVENAADVRPVNSGLLSLQLLDGGARQVISFVPSQVFDEVEFRITGVATALTEVNLFYVQQITPMAKVVSDTVNVCSGQTATLNANFPAGATFTWYDAPSGGNLLFTGASYTTPAITADGVYYVSAVSGTGCASETRKPVFVKVGLASVSVTSNNITIPQGGTATFNVNTPNAAYTYKWYSVPSGGTALFTGTSFTTPPLNATTTYYVEATTSTGCASAQRIPVIATVQITNPDAPCDIATAQTSNVNGICLGCYVDNQASAIDASTTTFSTIHIVAGLLGGYAQQTLIFPNPSDQGDSVRLVMSFPASLADAALLGSVDIATYNGAQYNNDRATLTGGGLLNLQLLPGNQQAIVTFAPSAIFDRVEIRMNAGLATAISAANIHFAQRFIPVPDVTPDTVNTCVGSTATIAVAPRTNTIFRWYSQATGGTPLFTGTTFQSGPVSTDTAFYVEAVKASINCPNPIRTKAVVKITGAPAAPTLDNVTVNTCAGTTATIKATAPAGATFRWYAQQTGGTPIFTGDTFITAALDSSAIYYAETVSSGGCASTTRTAVQVNITARPATPDVTPPSATICAGNMTTLTATSATPGVTFNWYSSAAMDNLLFTGASFTTPALTTTTSYFVVAVNGQCVSAAAKMVTVTVNEVPIKPGISINPASGLVEYGQTATLTATSASPGATYRWFLDSLSTTPIFTGAVFTTPVLTNNTRYFVEAVAAAGCASARTGATVLVNRNFNPGCDFANAQTNSTFGLCVLCAVNNPDNSVDNDTTNAANLSIPLGIVGGGISYFMNFGSLASAGDTVKVRLSFPTGLIDLSLLSNITITSYNGGTSNGDTKSLDAAGLKLVLLGGSDQRAALFAPGAAYDRIEIRVTGLATLLTSVNIQYANRILASPTVTVDNSTVCAGAQATLTATASDSTTVRWYTVPTGGTPVFTGKVFTTPVLNVTTTYYAESFRASTNCANPIRTSATIQVLTVPQSPQILSGDTAICAGNSAILRARAVDPTHTIRWFLSATGGTAVSLDSLFITGALTTNTTYYAEAYNGSCGSAVRIPVVVTVSTAPSDPVLESGNLTICSGTSATLRVTSATTGITINWYTVQSGGTPAGTGAQFITPSLSTTTIYYVEATSTAGGCPNGGGRIQAVVNVNSTPAVPVLADSLKITCRNQQATLSIQNPVAGITYNWYSAATGGTLLHTGATYVTAALLDSATFFVEAVGTGNCPSTSRAIARVSVVTTLNPPTVESANVTVCRGAQATLRVTDPLGGVTYNWYDAPGGNKLFTGAVFLTGVQVAASSYFVEAVSAGGCASATMTRVDVAVTDAPTLPVVLGSTTICQGDAVSLSIQSPGAGLTYSWYDAAAGGNRLAQGVSFAPTGVTSTITYYVEASSGICSSAGRTPVTIVVNPAPPAVTVDATTKTVCIGNTAELHVVNPQPGLTYRWYDAATGGTIVSSSPDFITPALSANKDYYVAAINGSNCASVTRTRVSVTVTNGPAVPAAPAEVTVCRGNRPTVSVQNVNANLQYRWYDAPIGGTLLFTGTAYSTADPLNTRDTVYLEASLPGGTCVSNGRAQVILIPADAPGNPVLVNSGAVTVCTGTTATFNVQNPTANVTYRWYDAATGGNVLLANGTSYTTGNLTANMDVYVEALIGGGCASAGRAKGTATIAPVPGAPLVTADANTVCPDSSATLRASSAQAGLIFSWYTTATGGTAVFTGPVFRTPGLKTATTYYAAAGFNGGCMSTTRTPITINIYSVLPAPTVSVATKTPTSVTFQWNAIPGALGYRVSADGGITFTQPSSGLTGTTHTVVNLLPNQTITLQVMSIGATECANSAWFQGGGGTDNPAGNAIFVPNAFTPNADGLNDVLLVYGTTIATMEIRIFNQWGQLVFESKDKGRGWDGTMSGKKQPVGVYNYILRASLQDGTTVSKRGTITIVR